MKECKLSPRLQMVADMVEAGSVLVDVGTDHAYLPANLILNSTIEKAFAVDVRKGPLENAGKTAREYGIKDKITLVLSDGLKNVDEGVYNIVLAGMGGTLIVNILSAVSWIKQKGTRLILQPQSHTYDVRKFLDENGFEIVRENASFDDGHCYISLLAEFTGDSKKQSDEYYYIGELCNTKNDASVNFIKKEYNHLNRRYNGLLLKNEDSQQLESIKNALEYIKNKLD
ncbi:MAG: class I SAM-dependent methyltransferase [Clostridiales bacterium]|nr:class I SAM-dependent methyltransferase [Clostridiales bacterium]